MTQGRLDSLVDIAAGAVMAGAVGYCLFTGWMPGQADIAGGGSLLAFAGTFGVMRKVSPAPNIAVDDEGDYVPALEFGGSEEVDDVEALSDGSDEGRVDDDAEIGKDMPILPDDGELVLDDIVAELAPQSRVVRLFAPEPVVDPAELKARVDRHLAGEDAAEDADARELLASKPELSDEAVDATNRLAAALDRVRQRLD